MPDNVVTIYDMGGIEEGRTNPDSEKQEHQGLQVRVRAGTYPEGFTKIQAVALALDQQIRRAVVNLGLVSYRIDAVTRTTTVIAAGRDLTTKRFIFTTNARISLRQL
jgi:hypothetical protein